jgi:hypothetical protein
MPFCTSGLPVGLSLLGRTYPTDVGGQGDRYQEPLIVGRSHRS